MIGYVFLAIVFIIPAIILLKNDYGSKRGCGRGCATCGNRDICYKNEKDRSVKNRSEVPLALERDIASFQKEFGEEFNWELIEWNDKSVQKQVHQELKKGHPLFGMKLNAVARCTSNDDVLCIRQEDQIYISIHLTYNNNGGTEFPRFVIVGNQVKLLDYLRQSNCHM